MTDIIAGDGLNSSSTTVARGSDGWGYETTLSVNYDTVADQVLLRLRERLPADVLAFIGDGDGTLDNLSLAALADWLEERQYGEMAGHVRKLIPQKGDVYVLEHSDNLSVEEREATCRGWEKMFPGTTCALLHNGLKLAVVLKRKGASND